LLAIGRGAVTVRSVEVSPATAATKKNGEETRARGLLTVTLVAVVSSSWRSSDATVVKIVRFTVVTKDVTA
jgi:hypothetical protein